MEQLKDLYYQYFANRDEYGRLEVMPETKKTEKDIIGFFEKYLLGDEVFYPTKIRLDIEELITSHAVANEMQGWIYGYMFAMQMFAACGVRAVPAHE